jgi:pyruvate formate lyase activating enzyme
MHKLTNLPETPVATLEKARQIALNAGIKYSYIGNAPGTKAENTSCPHCKKLLLERKGYFILQNNMIQNRCSYCNETIDGVWT